MTLAKLIAIVNAAYNETQSVDHVLDYHEHPNEDYGDTLAKFIAVEIAETFDESADDETQLQTAATALEKAVDQLNVVIGRLHDEIDRVQSK